MLVAVDRRQTVEVGLAVAAHLLAVVRVGQRIDDGRVRLQIVGAVPVDLQEAGRIELDAGLDVPVPHAIAAGLQCQLPDFVGRVQLLHGGCQRGLKRIGLAHGHSSRRGLHNPLSVGEVHPSCKAGNPSPAHAR